jgi:Ca2+-binding EF-hand superfamily protein
MDRDNSGSISANELANVAVGGSVLGIDNGMKLIRVFDVDNNGTIGTLYLTTSTITTTTYSTHMTRTLLRGVVRLQRVRLASQVPAQHAADLQAGTFPLSLL